MWWLLKVSSSPACIAVIFSVVDFSTLGHTVVALSPEAESPSSEISQTHTQTQTQTQTQAHHSQGQAHTRGIVCWSSNISAPIYIWAQSPFIFGQFLVIWSEISVIISRRIHNKADASLKGKGSIEPVWSERRTKASQTAVVVVTIHWIGKLRQLVDLKVNQLTSSLSSWSSSSSSSWSRPVWSWGCGRRRRTWGCLPAGAPTREQKEKIKQRHQNRTTRKWNNEHITQSLWKLLWFFFATKEKNCQGQKMGFLYFYMTKNVTNYCGGKMNESDSWAKCKWGKADVIGLGWWLITDAG